MSEFDDVKAFHIKFKQIVNNRPVHLTKRKLAERANFMLEELKEFAEASGLLLEFNETPDPNVFDFKFVPNDDRDQDLAGQADALIDLVYVAKGTAVMKGLPWKRLWNDVHAANMRKELRPTPHRAAFQAPAAMIGKPEGWVGPETLAILEDVGYERLTYVVSDPTLYKTDPYDIPIDDAKCHDDMEKTK